MIVPPDVQLKTPYSIRIRQKMQKEIPKRIPIYAPSIKVIEKRRSDVPLKPHRRKFPSFGSGKITDSGIRRVVRLYVILYFSLSRPFHCRFMVSAHQRQESRKNSTYFGLFRQKTPRMPPDLRKRRKKIRKKKRKPPSYILADKR